MVYTVGNNGHSVKAVYLDGEDITNRCFFVSDGKRGEVGLYKTDANGKFYLDPIKNDVAREFKRGKVVVVLKEWAEEPEEPKKKKKNNVFDWLFGERSTTKEKGNKK